MNAAQIKKMVASLKDNGGMITVYKHHVDGTVTEAIRTFRVDSVAKFLRRKSGTYSVSQRD